MSSGTIPSYAQAIWIHFIFRDISEIGDYIEFGIVDSDGREWPHWHDYLEGYGFSNHIMLKYIPWPASDGSYFKACVENIGLFERTPLWQDCQIARVWQAHADVILSINPPHSEFGKVSDIQVAFNNSQSDD